MYPCIALEDIAQSTDVMVSQNAGMVCSERSGGRLMMRASISVASLVGDSRLHDLGRSDLNFRDWEVSPFWKNKLIDMVEKYECVFSRHTLNYGEAKSFCHRIRVTDDMPFCVPYRRLCPTRYLKLKKTLSEMQKEIIRKSNSEFASPLVLVWKKG